MPAFMKIGDIKGEATEKDHKDWILVDSVSAPVHRKIPEGAAGVTRMRGDTVLGDVIVVRHLDSSSVKLQEACANGTLYKSVEIHLTTIVGDKSEPYLKYKLENVIISSYGFHGNASGDPLPTEDLTFNYTKVEWTYVKLDPQKGTVMGNVVGKYEPGHAN